MTRVDKRDINGLTPLGQGGMANVYLVGDPISQLPGKLAYKELKKPEPGKEAKYERMLDTMRLAVGLRAAMSPAEQAELDEVTVWPLAMVHDNGKDVGLLMRCIHDDYFIKDNSGRRVFEFQLLGAAPEQAKANGFDQSRKPADKDVVRLALMARLAHAVEIIHRPRGNQKLVYGDLNLRNAAVAINPPRIVLMDCDGVADVNDGSRVQPNTPFFVPPELKSNQQKLQDQETDIYKLGLCVIRGLSTGRGSTQITDPAHPHVLKGLLDPAGIELLRRAVGDDRSRRPAAEEIKDYLVGRVLDLVSPPTALSAELSNTVALRGSKVAVRWTHKGGKKVRIYTDFSNVLADDLDADGYPNGYPIESPTDCEVLVAVINDDGEDTASAGRLYYYEVPPPQISLNPPAVALQDLPVMNLPTIRPDLPPYPMHLADAVPLPALQWPQLPPPDLGAVAPGNALMKDLRRAIGRAYHAADAGIDRTVRDVLRRKAKKLRVEAEKDASTP